MFGRVLSGGVRSLTLGARDHALINGTMIGEIVTCFRLRDWTCHICGVRLPGLMEVDHLKGHQRCSPDAIAPICQFCHDLRHPVWAVSRKRLFPVLAPGLDQRSLSRFSWSLLAEMTRPGGQDSFEELSGSISERESAAFELLDGDNLESALEAILVIRDRSGQEAARKVAEELDAQIRFLPTCVRDGEPLKRWTPEGFRDVPIELLHEASGPPPDFERLRLAAEELRDR